MVEQLSISVRSMLSIDERSEHTEIDTTFLKKKESRRKILRWADESDQKLAEIVCLLVPSKEMDDDEKCEVWFQDDEFEGNRRLAKHVAVDIRTREPSSAGAGYVHVVSSIYAGCMTSEGPSELEMEKMAHWTRVGHSRRGLEKWSVVKVSKIRQKRRARNISAVLEQQRLSGRDRDSTLNSFQKTGLLRVVSEKVSLTSRRFATAMGEVDAMAVHNEPPPDLSPRSRNCLSPQSPSARTL